jgi:murein DD-endopeptidase MepM/ murein hydrolase activator NlpD
MTSFGARFGRFLLVIAIAVGWYNNGGAEAIQTPWRIVQLSLRPADTTLLMPVQGVTVGRVADTWHARRARTRKHEGQDIFASKGTRVLSATEGVVVRVGQNRLGGNIVAVLGAAGRYYYYAHLDRYADGLETGQLVEAGQLLGHVGNSGNARGTPPHLHFGVYSAAGAINPLPLLNRRLTNT